MKIKNITSFIFKTKKRILVFIVVIAAIAAGIFFAVKYNYTAEADTTALNKLLIEASDLTTAKLNITNMTEYKDEGISFLNRADFIMVYNATVWAGIDMSKVDIVPGKTSKVIYVTIPKATIQDAKVDPSSIKYFDEKFALFNVNEKEDVNNAVALAEEAVKEDAVKTGILDLADKQSSTLVEGLLSKALPDGYTLDIKVAE